MIVVIGENGCNIEEVAESTKAESDTKTDSIGDTAAEEAYTRKHGVESGIGIVDVGGIDLAGSSHTVDSIEHARAQEADHCDKDDLKLWGGIGRNSDEAQVQ